MDPINLGSIIVAGIAAAAAWATQRAASKATVTNTSISGRLDAEKEAYERARAMDIETIERQNQELEACRKEIADLKTRLKKLEDRTPVAMLGLEGILRERERESGGNQE